jgi:hypothetical protein
VAMTTLGSAPDAGHPSVRELQETEYDSWRQLVAASPQGSTYALPEYLDVLCEATDARFRIVGVFVNDLLVGGVPLYERRSRVGHYVANRLLLHYNGIVLRLPAKKSLADQTALTLAVLGALEHDLASRSYARLHLHNRSTLSDLRPFLTDAWQVALSYTYVVPLGNLSEQWERVDPNFKRLIRRCEREGVAYREDTDFGALYQLHLQTHERKGAPVYLPERAFARYFERLHALGLARLGHACLDGKPIASLLMLTGPHPVSHTVCAGADAAYLRTGASAFLRWHAFGALARDGFSGNDLTDASLNPVTRFKSQFGGELTPTWSIARADSLGFRLEEGARRWKDALQRRLSGAGGKLTS